MMSSGYHRLNYYTDCGKHNSGTWLCQGGAKRWCQRVSDDQVACNRMPQCKDRFMRWTSGCLGDLSKFYVQAVGQGKYIIHNDYASEGSHYCTVTASGERLLRCNQPRELAMKFSIMEQP